MTLRYEDVVPSLRTAYDGGATERDWAVKQQFKLDERAAFMDRLRVVEAKTLLEIGAGTGQDSVYFREAGLDVVAVDLSPAAVELCRAKGLEAYARDFLNLGFAAESFDAVYAMNCLLHVPNVDLPEVLLAVRSVLKPGGLFFAGQWGGAEEREGILEQDHLEPKRFFSWRTDAQFFAFVSESFEVIDFHPVEDGGLHFQSSTLVRPID